MATRPKIANAALTESILETATGPKANKAARICTLNALAAIKGVIGDLDRIKQIVRVVGYVASVPTFTQQPAVVNGASEVLLEIFGENGKHAR
jgi:enamine deaminase RidA (YjgF/YER057c/UK114 family)